MILNVLLSVERKVSASLDALMKCPWITLTLHANKILSRFVLSLTNAGTPAEKKNVRLIAHGYKYVDKPYIQGGAP